LAEWLDYLGEIGYRDLYLRPRAAAPANVPSAPPPAAPRQTALFGNPEPPPAASAPPALALSPEERLAALDQLAQTASRCRACKLCEGRHSVVFGSGDPRAELMFIGEGPGADEDRQGLPFVGRAGELLTKIIRAIDMERSAVYIGNIVKCRPPGNRDPEPDEVAACRGFIERQVDLVAPKVIVALGRIAAQTLLDTKAPLGRLRGQWFPYRGALVRVTYHPAALLRNPDFKRPTWEDMQLVRDRLKGLGAG
jgi:DNA polymerase